MRHEAYPGEDQATLAKPKDVAERFVPLAMPDFAEAGRLRGLPRRSVVTTGRHSGFDPLRQFARQRRVIEIDMHMRQHRALRLDPRDPRKRLLHGEMAGVRRGPQRIDDPHIEIVQRLRATPRGSR